MKKIKQPRLMDFKKLTAAEKRVRIAKDVIDALNTKRITANRGGYILPSKGEGDLFENAALDTQVRDAFSTVKHCEVCALGGIFVAAVERFDRIKIKNLNYMPIMRGNTNTVSDLNLHHFENYLYKFFSRKQLAMIEMAFEDLHTLVDVPAISDEEEDAIFKFSYRFKTAKNLMIAIMENIIKNKGTFKPNKI